MRYVIAVVALFLCMSVSAEPYAVLGGGMSTTKAADSTKSTASPYAGFGYRFGNFAVEAGYLGISSGDKHESISSSASGTTIISVKRDWNGHGIGVFGMGFRPLNSTASMFGRVGAYRVSSKTKTTNEVSTLAGNTSTEDTISENVWAPAVGIGAQDKMREHLNIRGMIEYVQGHGEFKRTVMGSVGLMYSF